MRATVTLEYRFRVLPDKSLWTATTFAYPFWERYLEVFDEVQIVARALPVDEPPEGWRPAPGPQVSAAVVPYYVGPYAYLCRCNEVKRAIISAFRPGDAILLRLGSRIGRIMRHAVKARSYPYGVEVVADPYDVFAPGALKHPLRPFFRWEGYWALRCACREAAAAGYVTDRSLQRRYPGGDETVMAGFSDLELSDDLFLTVPRIVQTAPRPCNIIMVGGLNQLYKAPHILVSALAEVCGSIDAHLTFVGGGQYEASLQRQAEEAGIGERVSFMGEISSRRGVIDALDRADIFVLPSFQEGLPRAMVEAMARGLPCIGSSVGGIPELLTSEDLVPPGDSTALAHLIIEVASDPERLSTMSRRNVARAQDFREEPLRRRRQAFYWALRERTEQFLAEKGRMGLQHAHVT